MPIPRLALRARRHRSRLPAGLAAAVTAVLLATAAAASAATPHHAAGPVVAAPAARSSAAVAPRLTTDTDAGCNTTVPRGYARCFAVIRTPADHLVTADADGPPAGSLGPADIRSAYDLPSGGGGQTVAIVDAFGDSHAESDLAAFRSHYGLPACTTANGCFRKVDQTGGTAYPADDPGWGGETSLDLDAVSSACPACNILLVEADDNDTGNLADAAAEGVALGARFESNSYGAAEFSGEQSGDTDYDHPGVVVTVSTGDTGNQTEWPSTDGNVIAVGGTTLAKDDSARGWSEAAWSGGGSGCSAFEPRPDDQLALTTDCTGRAVADISADADPASGLGIYDTLGSSGWLDIGGTSLAAPLVASMYALAGTPTPGTYPVTYPYHDAHQSTDINDVTQGSDGSCGNVLCTAGTGWDGPTGLGTPAGVGALSGGPHGDITGQVTDASTGAPLAGAEVSATPGGYRTRTDAKGDYDISAEAGTYSVTAAAYAYASKTVTGVSIAAGTSGGGDFALTPAPSGVVSGTVTDGSGHGWPLYAEITIDGYPGGPVHTDPTTGKYQVKLAGDTTYTMHVAAMYPGYTVSDTTVRVGTGAITADTALTTDGTCTAPGYRWQGNSEPFTDWQGATPQDGWTVSGTGQGWRFDNPGGEEPPPGGDDRFAVVDSGHDGTAKQNAYLTSPVLDLTGQRAPALDFDSGYYGAPGQTAAVQLSTDSGGTWSTVWQRTTGDTLGAVALPIPTAARHRDVVVRFHFTGTAGWWWSVDDVFVGTHTCVATAGGLVVGTVTDATSGTPLYGAEVAGTTASHAAGTAAPTTDPALPAVYWLFSPDTGSRRFTAADPGYASATAAVTVTADRAVRRDWALTSSGG